MKTNQSALPESIFELQEMVLTLSQKNRIVNQEKQVMSDRFVVLEKAGSDQARRLEQIESENRILREELQLLRLKMFGSKSEKLELEEEDRQGTLFPGPAEPVVEESEHEVEEQEEITYTRRKSGRRPLPKDLPRTEIVHEIPESERMCCGEPMTCFGQEESERLVKKPAVLSVEVHIRKKYACRQCQGVESDQCAVLIAPPALQLVPKSLASESLLADLITAKFADGLPYYRQQRQYERLGIELGRDTMCNLTIKVWLRCRAVEELLRQELLSGSLVQMDETRVQVLDEEGKSPQSLSYMWACRGGPPEKPTVYFRYAPTRSGSVAKEILGAYRGHVQTDGYAGYDFLDSQKGVIHAGCWAHARRKFFEAAQAGNSKPDSKADKMLRWIKQLYQIEKKGQELPPEELLMLRQTESAQVVKKLDEWLQAEALRVLPQNLLGKAISYTLGQWPRLQHFLKNPLLPLDTNRIENNIRPFVVGRKNWLFSKSTNGAHASAFFYSLIETAKANGLEPFSYLNRLFTGLLTATTEKDYLSLFPQHIDRTGLTPYARKQ